jgi:hypothetical protein
MPSTSAPSAPSIDTIRKWITPSSSSLIIPLATQPWFVTTNTFQPALRSRTIAAAAPGISSMSSGTVM